MKQRTKKILGVSLLAFIACALLSVVAFATDGDAEYTVSIYATFWSLLPPIIAIALALITKEVYTSLFVGIIAGALLYSNFNLERMINAIFFAEDGGMVAKLADSWNIGILIFLVILGIMVALMNAAGGSAAFGRWASTRIKTRSGAQFATFVLGVLIFVDDYFNCLTVGSVMLPVTDKHGVSRSKLAYIIDATAAPICIIAPISSWAAAVTSSVPEGSNINGFQMFLQTIPYNLYAILSIVMMIVIIVWKFDYGPMRRHEQNAMNGDLYTTDSRPYANAADDKQFNAKGKVIDLILPVIVLVASCILCMVYTGGFFDGESFISAFADSDASVGLVLGSFIALVFTFVYYMIRRVLTFKQFADCIPEGFKAMVPAILILTFAWTISGMTGLLGGADFVANLVEGSAAGFQALLPAIIFLVAVGLSFATGTSWGTFGILIPIVCAVFPEGGSSLIISISACLAGSVCGDHCSPISDTTIMASAGAQSDHINHVSTQLPYAMTVAAVSFVGYVLAGFVQQVWIVLPVSILLMIATLFIIRKASTKKA